MSAAGAQRAGRPFVGLVAVAAVWILIRFATFQPALPDGGIPMRLSIVSIPQSPAPVTAEPGSESVPGRRTLSYPQRVDLRAASTSDASQAGVAYPRRVALEAPTSVEAEPVRAVSAPTYAAAHGAIFLSVLSRVPNAALPARLASSTVQPGDVAVPRRSIRRWSIDAWAFVRQDSSRAGFGLRPGTLGASQVGYVARYSPAPESKFKPAIYSRLTKALIDSGETDTALGVQLRPVPALPVNFHGEVRATAVQGRSFVRPAVFATGGFYDVPLGFGLTSRGYVQGGYVGGEFATGFIDGHVLAERRLLDRYGFDMRIGGGAWGGAQQGVSRLDVGPVASYTFTIADKPVRLQADYRFRVAGNAEPADGASITLSTSF